MATLDPYPEDFSSDYDEFHAVFTIQLGELIHDKLINFTDGTWDNLIDGTPIKWYSAEQEKRFWTKFAQHFYWREIGEEPFKRWKYDLLELIGEVMPKYCYMYMIIDKNIDPMQIENEYGKRRDIFSDFPQSMLGNNEDYASSGNDNEFENIRDGGFVEMINLIRKNYTDPDAALLRELDSMFYCVLTSNINGY